MTCELQSKYARKIIMQCAHLKQSFNFVVNHLRGGRSDLIQFEER